MVIKIAVDLVKMLACPRTENIPLAAPPPLDPRAPSESCFCSKTNPIIANVRAKCKPNKTDSIVTPYSNSIAQLGQTDAQHPQFKQISLSMTILPSFSEIPFTGQTSAHSKHFWHFSAIIFTVLPQITSHNDNFFQTKEQEEEKVICERIIIDFSAFSIHLSVNKKCFSKTLTIY